MTIIEEWTGRHAHALRAALRMTNESFAHQLGVAPRTVTKWRERPDMVPSKQIQQALDTALRQVPPDVRVRFAANLGLGALAAAQGVSVTWVIAGLLLGVTCAAIAHPLLRMDTAPQAAPQPTPKRLQPSLRFDPPPE